MLVLVTQLIETCFVKFKHKLESIIAIFLLFLPTFCFSQTNVTGVKTESPAHVSRSEKSVLVLVEGKSSHEAAPDSASTDSTLPGSEANGTASLDTQATGNATFTAQPLSSAPEPPQDLLMPANPTESSFTRPLANELRGETLPTVEGVSPSEDNPSQPISEDGGSTALGTFATTNQTFQGQQSNAGVPFGSPVQDASRFQVPPSNPSQFGQPVPAGGTSSKSGPQFSSQAPALSGSRPSNNPPLSDQPSAWRDVQVNRLGQTQNSQSEIAPLQPSEHDRRITPTSGSFSGLGQLPSQPRDNNYNAQSYGQLNNRDTNVRPTGFMQPVAPPERSTDLAKRLIARYSADNVSDALPGQPTRLIEMLRQPISVQMRRPMVHQYWETYFDWANYISAKQYEQWLTRLPTSVSPSEKTMLDAAIAIAGDRTLAAEIQLGKSQSGLLQYMPNWRSSDLLPLPDDLPLIQKYKTNYELYRSRQLMPVSLRGIDQMLPKTLELINRRAESVQLAKVAVDQVLSALANGQSDLVSVLEAGQVWRAAERDLVASVVGYNQAIGDYSMSVTGGYQSPEEVVAMLIAKPQAVVAQASSVLQRQPEPMNSNTPAADAFLNQSRRQNQAAGAARPEGAFADGQGRQRANAGSGEGSNFNLDANGAFRSNPADNSNGASGASVNGTFPTPSASPITTNPFGDSSAGGAGNGFGPTLPR